MPQTKDFKTSTLKFMNTFNISNDRTQTKRLQSLKITPKTNAIDCMITFLGGQWKSHSLVKLQRTVEVHTAMTEGTQGAILEMGSGSNDFYI